MKFVIGSRPASFTQLSRPTGQSKAGDCSGAVSATWSPAFEQPFWNVWYSPSQCPTS